MDKFTKKKRSWIMSRVRSESGIEKIPRGLIGLYLRRHPEGIIGKPDFGNKARRIALFIDGCFWHGCPRHYKAPKTNKKYWIPKIEANRKRDRKVTRLLRKSGWRVIRAWECELDR